MWSSVVRSPLLVSASALESWVSGSNATFPWGSRAAGFRTFQNIFTVKRWTPYVLYIYTHMHAVHKYCMLRLLPLSRKRHSPSGWSDPESSSHDHVALFDL